MPRVDYNGLLNRIRDVSGTTLNTRRVEIAAISADLPGVSSSSTDHVIDLKPIELTARELKELFYPTGDEFTIGEECSLSDCLKNKLKFDNMVTCSPEEQPLNLTKEIVNNIVTDLDIDTDCWDDCSRVNVDKALSGITSILDLTDRCRDVDCSMTFNEYLGVLSRIGVSILNRDTNVILPENTPFNPETNYVHAIQAQEFNCEPVWWGAGEPVAPASVLSIELARREEYERLGFTYQQITTGVVFKIPNPDANDTVVRVNFNVNWASYQGQNTNAGQLVTFRSHEKVFKPYLPVKCTKITQGGVIITSGSGPAPGDWEIAFVDNKSIICVEDTSGFFNGGAVALYSSEDGCLITDKVKVTTCEGGGLQGGVISKTKLQLEANGVVMDEMDPVTLGPGTLVKSITPT